MFHRAEQRVSPGGSAQNTMRILQWLCDDTHECHIGTFCGGIGSDQRGSVLEKLVRLSGVDLKFVLKHNTECACRRTFCEML